MLKPAKILSFLLSIGVFSVLFVSSAKAAGPVCSDSNLNRGCPTCSCPRRGQDYFNNTFNAGSIDVNVKYLGNDVTKSFEPKVESMKPTSDWYYGPYDEYNADGTGSCNDNNFGKANKFLTCAKPSTDVACGYAKGEGDKPIKLNCLNGPFKTTLTFPPGYYPIEVPLQSTINNPGVATNVNICGQVNAQLNWEVGFLTKPQNVKCGQSGVSSIIVNFEEVYGATLYEIYRDGSLVGTTDTNKYEDRNLAPNKTYKYSVIAKRENYKSEMSEESTCALDGSCILPSTPAPTASYDTVKQGVNLTWAASTGNVEGYNVYRFDDENLSYSKINSSLLSNVSEYLDTDQALVCGKDYYYKIEATGCGQNLSSAEVKVNTGQCENGAYCSSITGPSAIGFNKTYSFTAQGSGKEPLSYSWSVVPAVGTIVSGKDTKTMTFKAPSSKPNQGYIEVHAFVSNSINQAGFECPAIKVNVSEDTGTIVATAKLLKSCDTTTGMVDAPDVPFNLVSQDDFYYFAPYGVTDDTGKVNIAVPLPKQIKYQVRVLDGKLYGSNLKFCPAVSGGGSTGWTENTTLGYHSVDVTLDPTGSKTATLLPIYVSKYAGNPSYKKWISVSQGNYTIRNTDPNYFRIIGDGLNVLSKAFGSIFTKFDVPKLDGGTVGPSDTNAKVYTYGNYDNEMNLNAIISTALNYDETKAEVKDCSNIETASYNNVAKGILKYRPVSSSNCTVHLKPNTGFTIPDYSVVIVEGNLIIERNMVDDGKEGLVLIVTGNTTVKEDVTIINANIISGGPVTVEAPPNPT